MAGLLLGFFVRNDYICADAHGDERLLCLDLTE